MTIVSHSQQGQWNHDAIRISIALCTYNGAPYLREQLDSLLAQTHANFEIVAVDDCSVDETVMILKEYSLRDARIKIHVNAVNLGVKNNFTSAFERCTGDYIAPCDQDDIWEPNKLALLLETIASHSLAYCDSALMNESGRLTGKSASDLVTMVSGTDSVKFLFGNCVSGHAMLFKREILDVAMPIPDEFFHDWWLVAVAASLKGVVYCPLSLVRYRQHGRNITNMPRDRIQLQCEKLPGCRTRSLHEYQRRIGLLAKLPRADNAFLMKLQTLWHARESQYFSFRLAWLIWQNGSRLYATDKRLSCSFLLRKAFNYFLGVKLKRIFNRDAYTPPSKFSTA
ncbi:MAG: glycosyltransferase family 2 protein [Steroidobacter sp.]